MSGSTQPDWLFLLIVCVANGIHVLDTRPMQKKHLIHRSDGLSEPRLKPINEAGSHCRHY